MKKNGVSAKEDITEKILKKQSRSVENAMFTEIRNVSDNKVI